jgi:hypothetical protein
VASRAAASTATRDRGGRLERRGLAIAVLATFLIVWRLNRPLAELAARAERLGRGGDPPRSPRPALPRSARSRALSTR